jgi:hypothetical protein
MTAKRKPTPHRAGQRQPAAEGVGVRRVSEGGPFELVHPRCVRDRADDLKEVHLMMAAGELDVAEDELRWLVQGCRPFLEAHRLLGEIAMSAEDRELAETHFRFAYELGLAALPKKGRCRLPYSRPANRAMLEAGKGLAWCLQQAGKTAAAAQIVRELLDFDQADPLKLHEAFPDLSVP